MSTISVSFLPSSPKRTNREAGSPEQPNACRQQQIEHCRNMSLRREELAAHSVGHVMPHFDVTVRDQVDLLLRQLAITSKEDPYFSCGADLPDDLHAMAAVYGIRVEVERKGPAQRVWKLDHNALEQWEAPQELCLRIVDDPEEPWSVLRMDADVLLVNIAQEDLGEIVQVLRGCCRSA